ncbi:hypothetical protein MRX96_031053 [Rhipicephalus microplus]
MPAEELRGRLVSVVTRFPNSGQPPFALLATNALRQSQRCLRAPPGDATGRPAASSGPDSGQNHHAVPFTYSETPPCPDQGA